jgi:HEPN domain-containing protein
MKHSEDYLHLLDELYIESRYPGDFSLLPSGKPTQEDAQEFYAFALSIYTMVRDTL